VSLHSFDWDKERDTSAIDKAERSLLGTVILVPCLLDRAALLGPADFKSALRGQLFGILREFPKRRFDACLVAVEMERRGVKPPNQCGWIAAIGELLDHAIPDDETVIDYVRVIREAAILRRADMRRSG
jgi:hypothetical protein